MRTKISIAVIALWLTGCSTMTTETRITTQDLNHYKIDCSDKGQAAFLESQRVSERDEFINGLMIRSWFGYIASINDGTYQERRNIDEGRRSSVQRMAEYDRRKTCGK
jgi:hypothetical protein